MKFFEILGYPFVLFMGFLGKLGSFLVFNIKIFGFYFSPPYRIRDTLKQIESIGFNSLGVILLTSIFLGLVQAIQMYQGFHKFGAENMMGYTIFYSIGREIGPVFAALMVVSRAISAMAAELGTMRVTEQIDAIDTLAIDSRRYLIIPRVIAVTVSLPILIIVFDTVANISAYLISVYSLEINPTAYMNTITQYIAYADYLSGLFKGLIFGFFIGSIGAYIGYHTHGGARGVGISTTSAVVVSSVVILVLDYFIDAIYLILKV
jgi:phospholipid/cholesterol/gamma-HCH transport system permease protein